MYCQPGEDCWPNQTQIENFSNAIEGDSLSCLGLKKLVHIQDPTAHQRKCLKYTGLLVNSSPNNPVQVGDLRSCKNKSLTAKHIGNYGDPNPNCAANPFITDAYYMNNTNPEVSCMTPYQFLNNRNYKLEWMAAFIVTANTSDDIKEALLFARTHRLGVSIMATGHDLQDRNAGPGPNSLLIRTPASESLNL